MNSLSPPRIVAANSWPPKLARRTRWFGEKYWWLAWTSARSSFAYAGDVIGRTIFFTVILYIFLRLWRTTYGDTHSTELGGLSITQMLWYLTITEAILLSGPKVSLLIDEDVRTGSFACQLIRPMSYAAYRMATTLGERFARFAVNLLTGSIIAYAFVGPLESTVGILSLLVTLPLAFAIDFFGTFLVGLAAFWLEDTSGLLLLYSRGVLLVGGALIPLDLYPPVVQPLLTWLPFANVTGGPARLAVDPTWTGFSWLLVKQLLAVLVMGTAARLVYRVALRRTFVNGG